MLISGCSHQTSPSSLHCERLKATWPPNIFALLLLFRFVHRSNNFAANTRFNYALYLIRVICFDAKCGWFLLSIRAKINIRINQQAKSNFHVLPIFSTSSSVKAFPHLQFGSGFMLAQPKNANKKKIYFYKM